MKLLDIARSSTRHVRSPAKRATAVLVPLHGATNPRPLRQTSAERAISLPQQLQTNHSPRHPPAPPSLPPRLHPRLRRIPRRLEPSDLPADLCGQSIRPVNSPTIATHYFARLLPMRPIPGVHFIQGDFFESPVKREIEQVLGSRRVGLLLSDMAPSFTGNRGTDADRTMNLCEDVLAFSEDVLAFGGNMVVKFFMGGAEPEFRARLRERFERVVVEKPEASRKQSAEQYFVCIGKRETPKDL
ncbi:FtsJ-like methyltransferase-domain-containing protein [Kickxella alabastrina]|uniref:FtsJ-like methyltransferase-domain-containing protein n=1 Tax=Kickxella alabastrina TaxID=61397 RepID=UPI00221F54B2|nr:FtsJ-like methyltransferase-domain-containing protein [Kickxella alabastrina]KAI7831018.1 FtsJ-like methyltransferase-domain-containing protein [Kickxella alabastrina]